MDRKKILYVALGVLVLALIIGGGYWYKTSYKKEETPAVMIDTTAVSLKPSGTLTLPHADTSVIPLLTKVLDDAFASSAAKDYNTLGSLIVYRGPDQNKHGYDVFNAKNSFDKAVVKTTADVFVKWNNGVESVEYSRAFELPQPDGRTMTVLEVIFVSPKNIDRKFFGFLLINNEWKIADVTSYI